jgi:hypothetical protein
LSMARRIKACRSAVSSTSICLQHIIRFDDALVGDCGPDRESRGRDLLGWFCAGTEPVFRNRHTHVRRSWNAASSACLD